MIPERELSSCPAPHQLRAAANVMSLLSTREPTPEASARLAYSHFASEGLFSPHDLVLGETILLAAGLVRLKDAGLVAASGWNRKSSGATDEICVGILAAYLGATQPVWLTAVASRGILAEELVPEEVLDALQGLMPDPERREAFLLNAARLYDDSPASEIGAIAEDFVVELAKTELAPFSPALADGVARVSLVSDQLGYDVVAPLVHGGFRRMEVKATGGLGRVVTVFLSRNEAEVGLRDPDWALVICRVRTLESTELLGWLRGESLRNRLPVDRAGGTWEKSRLSIHASDLRPGIPSAHGLGE